MKIISCETASNYIKDHMTVAIGGFGAYACPDFLLNGIAECYHRTKHPSDLTITVGIGTGNNKTDCIGLNRLCETGLIGTVLASHLANAPLLSEKVGKNEIAAYLYPLGVLAHLMRAIGGHKPGVLTDVGKYTMVDPENGGGCANEKARSGSRKIVEKVSVGGKELLFYPSFSVDAAVIRATYADEMGNLTIDHEAMIGLELEMATAAHNSGGIVIAQVEQIVAAGSIPPRNVRIHHSLVDYVVVSPSNFHLQGYASDTYRPELSGEIKVTEQVVEILPLNARKVIARRAAMELKPDMIINLGVGIPSNVGLIAGEEQIPGITLSLESGPIGGSPLAGTGFAASVNPESIGTLSDTFDFYDGGGLNLTCLGAAEVDRHGNVNVSSFNGKCTGPGGFINISQNTPNVCFLMMFTAGKTDIRIENGEVKIQTDGTGCKFVNEVEQVTFSAQYARQTGQNVLYITERAVFKLTEKGICLIEIAPGIDLQKDILDHMSFVPEISNDLKSMDYKLFRKEIMRQ